MTGAEQAFDNMRADEPRPARHKDLQLANPFQRPPVTPTAIATQKAPLNSAQCSVFSSAAILPDPSNAVHHGDYSIIPIRAAARLNRELSRGPASRRS